MSMALPIFTSIPFRSSPIPTGRTVVSGRSRAPEPDNKKGAPYPRHLSHQTPSSNPSGVYPAKLWSKRVLVEVLARHARYAPFRDELERRLARAGNRRDVELAPNRLHALVDRLSPDTVKWIVDEYQRGMPSTELARTVGVGKAGVLAILHEHGVNLRLRPMTEKEIAEAIRLYQQGWSLARVGKQLGRDHSAIRDVLERSGVPRRVSHGRAR